SFISSAKAACSVFIFSFGTSIANHAMFCSSTLRLNAFCSLITQPPESLQRQDHPQHKRYSMQYHHHDVSVHVEFASSYAHPSPRMGDRKRLSHRAR
ncbi:hypothetical protein D038_3386B, partial [Vibrio parahaemolyticus IDH02189]